MNRVQSAWAVADGHGNDDAVSALGAEVVEVVLSWRDASVSGSELWRACGAGGSNVLGVKQVKVGETLSLGEKGDLLVPEEVLCAERAEIVRFEGETATAVLPPGGRMRVDGWPRDEREIEIARGHVVELEVGAFVARLTRVRAESRPASAPLARFKEAGLGVIAGSALLHAAVFATIAFTCPSLGAAEEDPYDRDRILLMQKLLNAHAQAEQENKPDDQPEATGGDVNAGAQTRGTEGQAGTQQAPERDARWAARGTATPENAQLARERAIHEAETWGLLGMLPSALTDPNAPTVPWGRELNGSDDVSKVGHLFGGSIDDAFGSGGWGLSGVGEGGGGNAFAIGLNGLGGLGHTGTCSGPSCSGFGTSYGHPGGGYKPHTIRMRDGTPTTNGRLPAEVIQRVVRQNFGRYTFCYQNGLRSNPTLEGRVTVRFVIARDGSVAIAADGGSDIPDKGVAQCVVSSFTNLSFPAPDNGTVTVVYPLMFHPE